MANPYVFHSRISGAKFRQILRLFALDLNAVQIADLTGLSRVSINRHLTALRKLCEQAAPMSGEIEVDESYFGARRVKGKRGPRGVRQNRRVRHLQGFDMTTDATDGKLADPPMPVFIADRVAKTPRVIARWWTPMRTNVAYPRSCRRVNLSSSGFVRFKQESDESRC